MATFTTGRGYFNLSAGLRSMIDDDYSNYIDYDDETRWDLATFMMVKGNSEEVGSPEFYAWAGELNPRTGTFNNGTVAIATDTTNITVTSTDGIRVDDILHIATAGQDGEHCRVTSIGTDNVTVARINTTPATIATNATFVILGSASSETATTSIGASWMEPAQITNRCQLIRRSFELSRTEMSTDVRTKQSRLNQKTEQCRMDFRIDLGHVMWFSISTVDTTNTYFTSKGINEQLENDASTTSTDENGVLTYATIADNIQAMAPYSKSNRIVGFHGGECLNSLQSDLGSSSSFLRTSSGDKSFGTGITTVLVSDFSIGMKYERLFDVIGSPYSGYLFLLDIEALTLHHLQGNKFEFKANIHDDPGGEIVKSQFRAQIGLGITWPKRHSIIYGIAT